MERSEPRLLVIAFACMPGHGSESGTGWAWARIAARLGETWVLCRGWPGSPEELHVGIATVPEGHRIHPVVVPMPFLFGARPHGEDSRFERLEYLAWQIRALRVARRIARRERIDLVWHVSWSTAWLGSIGGLVGVPFVWGPVGGGVGIPWPVLRSLGRRAIVAELARSGVQQLGRWANPLVWLGRRRAALILAQNEETARWLPASARRRAAVFHHVAIDPAELGGETEPTPTDASSGARPSRHDRPPTALFAGRLVAWKGCWLAIEALARLDGWRLMVVGAGRDDARLRRLASALGVADRVAFLGRVDRTEALRLMRQEADVFLFPSLHDEGGWVVGEAICAGLPVVCIDRGGPPAIAGTGVPLGSVAETANRLAAAARSALESTAPGPPAPTIDRRAAAVTELLRSRGLLDPVRGGSGAPRSA